MDSLVSGVRALPQPEKVTSVGSIAEALHHIAGAMSDTQVMTVGESIVGWIGQSAGAFAHEARHIQAAVRKVQGAIANVIAALNEYQSVCNGLTQQIRSHQQNWDSNIAWYKKEVSEIQSRVGAASGGQFPLLDAVDGVEVAKAALRARGWMSVRRMRRGRIIRRWRRWMRRRPPRPVSSRRRWMRWFRGSRDLMGRVVFRRGRLWVWLCSGGRRGFWRRRAGGRRLRRMLRLRRS